MSHTVTQLTYHAVFSTKERVNLITAELCPRLYPYMASIINNGMGRMRELGGTPNHVHILFDLHQSMAVADAIRDIKSVSSGWVHDTFPRFRDFGWQGGYGAFSVSASAITRVASYIQDQEEHHRRRTFEEEFVAFLDKHGIEYDPRYLWK